MRRRSRRLGGIRWTGAALLTTGALLGNISVFTVSPFALGMSGVGLTSLALVMLSTSGAFARSLRVERGLLEAERWNTMRRIRRRGGGALVGLGVLAATLSAISRDDFFVLLVGLPIGLPLMFVGANLLLASVVARPSALRVRPTLQTTFHGPNRGAHVGLVTAF